MEMPHLIHDFQALQVRPESSVSLAADSSVETFDAGAARNLDSLPKEIQRKLMNKVNPVPLTDAERVTVRGFENLVPFIDTCNGQGAQPLPWPEPPNDFEMFQLDIPPSETVDPRGDRTFGITVTLRRPGENAQCSASIIKYHGDFTLVEYSNGQRQWLPLQNQQVVSTNENQVERVASCSKSKDKDPCEVTVKEEYRLGVKKETSMSIGADPAKVESAESCAEDPRISSASTSITNESVSSDASAPETSMPSLPPDISVPEKRGASPIPREGKTRKRYQTNGPTAQDPPFPDDRLAASSHMERHEIDEKVNKSTLRQSDAAAKLAKPQNQDQASPLVEGKRSSPVDAANQGRRRDGFVQSGRSEGRRDSYSIKLEGPNESVRRSTVFSQMDMHDLAREMQRFKFHITKDVLAELFRRQWQSATGSNVTNMIRQLIRDKNFHSDALKVDLAWAVDRWLASLADASRENSSTVGERKIREAVSQLVELAQYPWFGESLWHCRRQETLETGMAAAIEYLRCANAHPIAEADRQRLVGDGFFL
jgi:hypothetical protein